MDGGGGGDNFWGVQICKKLGRLGSRLHGSGTVYYIIMLSMIQ